MVSRVTYERPKSPCSTPPIQSKYCVTSGRSMPNSARVLASSSGVALTPSATCAGSPGSTAMNRNTTIDATSTLTTKIATRRSTLAVIAAPIR